MTAIPYAADPVHSQGRRVGEAAPRLRSEFQRDRDRIIHSAAFRRLEYKTQVFVNHEGDLYRTRLTHSLEVAQIARTIARALGLNEDLTEAIALAHDLGHTPFGHAGQDALNEVMKPYGGFEHNLQSLRVVDILEERYAEVPGLNLTFETREGILKHCSRQRATKLGAVGQRFLDGGQPSLEAQLTNLADEIAYNSHDVDDGLRAGLISVEGLGEVPLFGEPLEAVRRQHPGLPTRLEIHEVVRRLIDTQVVDLVESSRKRLAEVAPASIDEVRRAPLALIGFTGQMADKNLELKRYLRQYLYRHFSVHRRSVKAQRIVTELFRIFMADPRLLPETAQARVLSAEQAKGDAGRARAIADYIAGMTDRYAIEEFRRAIDPLG
jgi:dGTPase